MQSYITIHISTLKKHTINTQKTYYTNIDVVVDDLIYNS